MSMSMNLHERRDGSFTYFQPFLQMEKQDKKRMKGNKRTYRAQATLPTPDSLFLPRPFGSLSFGLTELPPFSRFYLFNRPIKKSKLFFSFTSSRQSPRNKQASFYSPFFLSSNCQPKETTLFFFFASLLSLPFLTFAHL